LPTRDQMADAAGFVSTQSGRIGSVAAAAGAIPGPHTPVAESTAMVTTTVGFAASIVEQLLRPAPVSLVVDGAVDLANYFISEKLPLLAPVSTEIGESVKSSDWANSIKKWGSK
jgi:filamentous hemagglutinin